MEDLLRKYWIQEEFSFKENKSFLFPSDLMLDDLVSFVWDTYSYVGRVLKIGAKDALVVLEDAPGSRYARGWVLSQNDVDRLKLPQSYKGQLAHYINADCQIKLISRVLKLSKNNVPFVVKNCGTTSNIIITTTTTNNTNMTNTINTKEKSSEESYIELSAKIINSLRELGIILSDYNHPINDIQELLAPSGINQLSYDSCVANIDLIHHALVVADKYRRLYLRNLPYIDSCIDEVTLNDLSNFVTELRKVKMEVNNYDDWSILVWEEENKESGYFLATKLVLINSIDEDNIVDILDRYGLYNDYDYWEVGSLGYKNICDGVANLPVNFEPALLSLLGYRDLEVYAYDENGEDILADLKSSFDVKTENEYNTETEFSIKEKAFSSVKQMSTAALDGLKLACVNQANEIACKKFTEFLVSKFGIERQMLDAPQIKEAIKFVLPLVLHPTAIMLEDKYPHASKVKNYCELSITDNMREHGAIAIGMLMEIFSSMISSSEENKFLFSKKYKKMRLPELRERAKELNIDAPSRIKKDELVEMITEAEEAQMQEEFQKVIL